MANAAPVLGAPLEVETPARRLRLQFNMYAWKLRVGLLNDRTKCPDPGLNWGPSDLQSDALPTELSRLCCSLRI